MTELLQSYRQRDALAQLAGMSHNPFCTEGELAADGAIAVGGTETAGS